MIQINKHKEATMLKMTDYSRDESTNLLVMIFESDADSKSVVKHLEQVMKLTTRNEYRILVAPGSLQNHHRNYFVMTVHDFASIHVKEINEVLNAGIGA